MTMRAACSPGAAMIPPKRVAAAAAAAGEDVHGRGGGRKAKEKEAEAEVPEECSPALPRQGRELDRVADLRADAGSAHSEQRTKRLSAQRTAHKEAQRTAHSAQRTKKRRIPHAEP